MSSKLRKTKIFTHFTIIKKSDKNTAPSAAKPKGLSKQNAVFCLLIALLLIGSLAIGIKAIGLSNVSWLEGISHKKPIAIISFFIIGIAVFVLCLEFLLRAKNSLAVKEQSNCIALNLKSVLFCSGGVLICWLPWIFIQFPCVVQYDTMNELYQHINTPPTFYTTANVWVETKYIDHHPVFDTLMYGAVYDFGTLISSQAVAFGLFAAIQTITTAVMLVISCCYTVKLGVPLWLRAIFLVFVALFPLFPQSTMTIIKDSTFAFVFIPFLLLYVEAFRTKGKFLSKKRNIALLIIFSGLCILTKKTGVYMVAPSLLLLLIYVKGFRKESAVALCATILCFVIAFPAIVYPAIGGVTSGGKQEALGFSFQQATLVAKERPSSINSQEYNAINTCFDLNKAKEIYSPGLTDNVKNTYRPSASNQDLLRFAGTYFSIGIRNPDLYAQALLQCSGPLYIPLQTARFSDFRAEEGWNTTWKNTDLEVPLDINRSKEDKAFKKAAIDAYKTHSSELPLLGILFTPGLYAGWIPFICFMFACRFNPKYLIALSPVLLQAVFLLICPTAHARYMIPVLYALPIVIGLTWELVSHSKISK